ncbi:uncharacterized protein [Solanum lycopersicum]|uniref:uncharacterized protein n=1 Tax=Solanum lycopersicum TaxID=4081 RepID=UPI00374A4A5A
MHKSEQDRRLIQFLMGLNEVYTVIRGNILMMSPLPSTAQAFSLLIQEEKQREYRPTSRTPMESVSLNANAGRGSQGGRGYRTNFSSNGELSNYNDRSTLICDFCKKQGHIKEKCYKLHGYPPKNNVPNNRVSNPQQFRQNNNQNFRGRKIVANAHGEECSQENSKSNAVITQKQYGHIMSLLQQFQVDSSGGDSKNNAESNKFAGPFSEEASGNW